MTMALVPLRYNVRCLFVRKGATALTVLSIAATVAVLAGLLCLQQGFARVMTAEGRDDLAVFLRPGANSEGESAMDRERAQIVLKETPEIALGASGGKTNVPLRGVQPASFAVHGDAVRVDGQHPTRGADELIVGQALVLRGARMEAIEDKAWDWVLGVNLYGIIHGIRSFVPRIRSHGEGGHIVNTASMAGMENGLGFSPYGASKFAVVSMSEGLCGRFHAGEHVPITDRCRRCVRRPACSPARVRRQCGDAGSVRPPMFLRPRWAGWTAAPGDESEVRIEVDTTRGTPASDSAAAPLSAYVVRASNVDLGFFDAFGVPVLAGRRFQPGDYSGGATARVPSVASFIARRRRTLPFAAPHPGSPPASGDVASHGGPSVGN
jgi:NAD(P)-dependent dehydrogenase (short-subunit alcohol dehydrogenase family)